MKWIRFLLLVGLLAFCVPGSAYAQEDVSSVFFSAYQEYQRAEQLEREGRNSDAIAKFKYVATQLSQVKTKNPDWQPLVVDFRLRKTQEAIVRLEGALDSQTLGPPPDLVVTQTEDVLPPVRSTKRGGQAGPSISILPGQTQNAVENPVEVRPSKAVPVAADNGEIEMLRRQLSAEKQRAADLEKGVQRSEAELLNVSMELEKTKVSVVDLTTQLRQFKENGATAPLPAGAEDIEQLNASVESLKESLTAVKADKEQLEAQSKESEQKIKELTEKLSSSEQELQASMDKAAETARAETEQAKAEAEKAKVEAEKIREEFEQAKAEAVGAQGELKARGEQSEQRIEELTAKLLAAEQQSKDAVAKAVAAVKAEVDLAKAETKSAQVELQAARNEAKKAKSQAEEAVKKVQIQAEKLKPSKVEEDHKVAKKELETAKNDIKTLTQNLAELERERAELIASRDIAQKRFVAQGQAGDKSAELMEANRQLEAKLSAAAKQLALLEKDSNVKSLTERVAALEKERTELLTTSESAQKQLSEAMVAVEENSQLLQINEQLKAQLAVEAAKEKVKESTSSLSRDIEKRVATLEEERKSLIASGELARKELADAKTTIDKHLETNRQLEKKLALANKEAGTKSDKRLGELDKRVAELEKERESLIASRTAAQKDLEEAKVAAEKKLADAKAAAEKDVAGVKAAAEQKLSEAKAAAEKEIENAKASAGQDLTEVQSSIEKKVAEAKAAADKEIAEIKAAAEKDVATAKAEVEASLKAQKALEEKLASSAKLSDEKSAQKIEELTQRVTELEKERADLIAARDSAQNQLAEAKSALEQNSKLIESNRQLEEKIAAANEQISNLKDDVAAKEEVIAGLHTDFEKMKTELADAQTKLKEDREKFDQLQAMNEQLLKEYDRATGALAAVQLGDVSAADAKSIQQENEVLRGVIMRQLKEQARREQVFRLAQEELQRLEIKSDSLSEKIGELAKPTLELTPAEQEMLKRPVVTLLDSDAAKMSAKVEVLKPQVEGVASGTENPVIAENEGAVEPASQSLTAGGAESEPALETPSEATAVSKMSPEVQKQIGEARDEFVKGNFSKAEELYKKIAEEHPDNIVALANLGVAQFRQGKLTAAQLALEKAVKLSPKDAFSLTTLGAVMIEQGRMEDAVEFLERSNAVTPDDPITLNYIGVASSQLGQFGKAEQALRRAISVNPDYAEAHFNLAVIYATAKPPSIALAKRHYERALELGAPPDARLVAMLKADKDS